MGAFGARLHGYFVAPGTCPKHEVDEIAVTDREAMFAIAAFAQDETFHAPAAIENYLRDFSIEALSGFYGAGGRFPIAER